MGDHSQNRLLPALLTIAFVECPNWLSSQKTIKENQEVKSAWEIPATPERTKGNEDFNCNVTDKYTCRSRWSLRLTPGESG